ncbi:MAG: hypothetical protein QNJ75_00995 [Acidimicrobiia bacterium]|nr:hypothetical protein [Acidimicrobiia bacterium]
MRALALVLLALSSVACDSAGTTTSTPAPTVITSTSTAPTSTVPTTTVAPTTTRAPAPEPASFSIAVGETGVTYDLDGDPPGGPTSFTVMDDGSVVVADTIAVRRGEPRLLQFTATGEELPPFELAEYDVASIVDVVSLGNGLALLDVLIAMDRYRVLVLDEAGDVTQSIDVPAGLRFGAGLTGLTADDDGLLLEYEDGNRYVRVSDAGEVTSEANPFYRGSEVIVTPELDRKTQLNIGMDSYTVTRQTDLGGVRVLGVAPNGTTLIVIDEVDTSGAAIRVTQRVQRRSPDGDVMGEVVIDVANQFVDIARSLEVGPTGAVLYLQAAPDEVRVTVLDL